MSKQQHQNAQAIARSLMAQGADPINVAQTTALAAGMVASHARLEPEVYQTFIKELAEALINEAGLSGNKVKTLWN